MPILLDDPITSTPRLSDAIVDGEVTKAPTQNAVYDALVAAGALTASSIANIYYVRDYITDPAILAAVIAGTNTADLSAYWQAAVTAGGGKIVRATPGDAYLIGATVYAATDNTTIDLNGSTVVAKSGLANGIFWGVASNITVCNGTIESSLSDRHAALRLGRLAAYPGISAHDCKLENVHLYAPAGFGLIGIEVRTKGVLNPQTIDVTYDGIRNLVFIDPDETQNYHSFYRKLTPTGGITTLNTNSGGDTMVGSIQTDVTAGYSWGVLLYDTPNSNTYRLWADEGEISILAGVVTFSPALPAGLDSVDVFAWNPAIVPADDCDGLKVDDCYGVGNKDSAIRINCQIHGYHKRVRQVDGIMDVAINNVDFDMPDGPDVIVSGLGDTAVITLNGCTRFVINNVLIRRAAYQGLHLEDGPGFGSISNVHVANAGSNPFYIADSRSITLNNLTAFDYEGVGLILDYSDPAPPILDQLTEVTNSQIDLSGCVFDANFNANAMGGIRLSAADGAEKISLRTHNNQVKNVTAAGSSALSLAGTARNIGFDGSNDDVGCLHRMLLIGKARNWYDRGGRSLGRTGTLVISNQATVSFGYFEMSGSWEVDCGTVTIAGLGSSSAINLMDLGAIAHVTTTLTAVDLSASHGRYSIIADLWWDAVVPLLNGDQVTRATSGDFALAMSANVLQVVASNITAGSLDFEISGRIEGTILLRDVTAI